MTARLVVVPIVLVALLIGATAAQPTSVSGGKRILRLPAPVTGLAADGSLVTATVCGRWPGPDSGSYTYWLYAWNPRRRSTVLMEKGGCERVGILAQGIAGSRVAWVSSDAGNWTESELVSATIRRPRLVAHLSGPKGHGTDDGLGDWVGNIYGDGSLLVFNTWSVCETSPRSACPEGLPPGRNIYNEDLWRIVGQHERLVLSSPDEATVLAVAAGRILVQRADGSLELRRADGSLLRSFPFGPQEVQGAVLDSSELVVLHRSQQRQLTWRVIDPVSGDQRVLGAQAGATPSDVERGRLVYTFARAVYVLRLSDGHRTRFTTPRGSYPLAQIELSGLFYSYAIGREGRVRFVPLKQIHFR